MKSALYGKAQIGLFTPRDALEPLFLAFAILVHVMIHRPLVHMAYPFGEHDVSDGEVFAQCVHVGDAISHKVEPSQRRVLCKQLARCEWEVRA